MSEEKPRKSGRSAEQQAARDARKAAKLASKPAPAVDDGALPEAGPSGTNPSTVKVSALQMGNPDESSATSDTKKPKGVNPEDYEIDLNAPEPLSKAELRAAKKRAKLGLSAAPEDIKGMKKRKLPEYDPLEDEREVQRLRAAGTSGAPGEEGAVKKRRGGEGEKRQKAEERVKVVKKNSIWVGNLAFKTTQNALKDWIEKGVLGMGGEEGSVTRVNMPRKPGKGTFSESRGFAYVDLSTPEMQKLAVGLSESMLEGRKLLIKLGDDHTASEAARTPKPVASSSNPLLKNQKHPESATLFVGNLPFEATEEGLRDLIEGNAATSRPNIAAEKDESDGDDEDEDEDEDKILAVQEQGLKKLSAEQEQQQLNRGGKMSGLRKVRLGAFEDTGKCKGFAFLDFLDGKSATTALLNRRNHFYGGRKLVIQYASEDATKRSGGAHKREPGTNKPPGGSFRPNSNKSRPSRESGPDQSGSESHPAQINRELPPHLAGHERETGGDEGMSSGGTGERRNRPSWGEREKKEDVRGKKWQATGRPRPGAALAMAKREKVGIVEGQGQKISFD